MPSWLPPEPKWGSQAPSWNQTIQEDAEEVASGPRKAEPMPSWNVPEWKPKA